MPYILILVVLILIKMKREGKFKNIKLFGTTRRKQRGGFARFTTNEQEDAGVEFLIELI